MANKKRYFACVYGGASERIEDIYIKEVEKLGRLITKKGLSLVYGAGASGIMGAVARGVDEDNGYVMGISPHFISTFEPIYECDNTVLVDTMAERKTLMEKHADVFIIAPGGIGTMDEFFQVLTLKYLNRLSTPIVIFNVNGFYDSLIALIEDLIKHKAVIPEVRNYYEIVTSADDEKLIKIFEDIKK